MRTDRWWQPPGSRSPGPFLLYQDPAWGRRHSSLPSLPAALCHQLARVDPRAHRHSDHTGTLAPCRGGVGPSRFWSSQRERKWSPHGGRDRPWVHIFPGVQGSVVCGCGQWQTAHHFQEGTYPWGQAIRGKLRRLVGKPQGQLQPVSCIFPQGSEPLTGICR